MHIKQYFIQQSAVEGPQEMIEGLFSSCSHLPNHFPVEDANPTCAQRLWPGLSGGPWSLCQWYVSLQRKYLILWLLVLLTLLGSWSLIWPMPFSACPYTLTSNPFLLSLIMALSTHTTTCSKGFKIFAAKISHTASTHAFDPEHGWPFSRFPQENSLHTTLLGPSSILRQNMFSHREGETATVSLSSHVLAEFPLFQGNTTVHSPKTRHFGSQKTVSVEDMMAFLCLINYTRHFISDFAARMFPLCKIMKKWGLYNTQGSWIERLWLNKPLKI